MLIYFIENPLVQRLHCLAAFRGSFSPNPLSVVKHSTGVGQGVVKHSAGVGQGVVKHSTGLGQAGLLACQGRFKHSMRRMKICLCIKNCEIHKQTHSLTHSQTHSHLAKC